MFLFSLTQHTKIQAVSVAFRKGEQISFNQLLQIAPGRLGGNASIQEGVGIFFQQVLQIKLDGVVNQQRQQIELPLGNRLALFFKRVKVPQGQSSDEVNDRIFNRLQALHRCRQHKFQKRRYLLFKPDASGKGNIL